ncbi:DUF2637 domain-containing protein [Streptomyces sp. NPDC005576]|uniref:DUF2637 domain-containing protein n=1 Tax=Streptomyces sp. NPDC005576 TaxID=3364726 RepID=UPI003694A40F
MTTTTTTYTAPVPPGSAPDRRAGAPATPGRGEDAGMEQTLTGDQDTAYRGATAPAAPYAAEAVPAATPAAPALTDTAPPAPRKGGRGVPAGVGTPVSTAPADPGAAPADVASPQATAATLGARLVGWLLPLVAGVGMPVVGVIGFAASYTTLKQFALHHGFSHGFAPFFPIGIDVSIVALLALDLFMVRRGTPWPVVRYAAHFMTLVTVVLNATEGIGAETSGAGQAEAAGGVWDSLWANPLWALSHAVMPGLFVLGIEGARKILMHAARIKQGTATDRVPLHRWVLSPIATARLYRRMRLAAVRSYPEMVRREQDLAGYVVHLTQRHGGDLKKASEIERLPITMAPRGYTVEEALALPERWQAEEEERERQKAERERQKKAADAERARQDKERQRQEAEDDRREAERLREAATAARIAEITDRGRVAEAEHRTDARVGSAAAEATATTAEAEVQAALRKTAAERAAKAEQTAVESETAAAARKRAAELADEAAALELKAARDRDEATRLADQAERRAQETERRTADRITREHQLAQTERATAEATLAAARAREETARIEAAAEAADDYLKLSQRQRHARRVARMLLVEYPAGTPADQIDPERVPLARIQDRLGAARTTAGELRQEAMQLLRDGYAHQAAADAVYEPVH